MEIETWEALPEMELVLPRGLFVWSFHGGGHLAQQISFWTDEGVVGLCIRKPPWTLKRAREEPV